MKYVKAFFAWIVGTFAIGFILTWVVGFIISSTTIEPATRQGIDAIVTLVVAIGVGIWVKRMLSQGTFGD